MNDNETLRDRHLADQTVAALDEAVARSVIGMARAGPPGGVVAVTTGLPTGAEDRSARIIRVRLLTFLGAGATYCPHANEALVLWWMPVPGCPICCRACTDAWLRANVVGTAEDDVCDVCRRPMGGQDYQQRHMIFSDDPPPGAGRAVPALTVPYAVCQSCQAAERSYPRE